MAEERDALCCLQAPGSDLTLSILPQGAHSFSPGGGGCFWSFAGWCFSAAWDHIWTWCWGGSCVLTDWVGSAQKQDRWAQDAGHWPVCAEPSQACTHSGAQGSWETGPGFLKSLQSSSYNVLENLSPLFRQWCVESSTCRQETSGLVLYLTCSVTRCRTVI